MSTELHVPARGAATPRELGIGMRLSIHPHCDSFVEVILGALGDAKAAGRDEGLVVETDEVSSYVGAVAAPAEQRLTDYLVAVITAASRRTGGGHVVAHVLLSRGCPGETTCDLSVTRLPAPAAVRVEATGISAAAQWSLYPLLDGDTGGWGHMAHIAAAVELARERAVVARSTHYATTLTGDLAAVLATAVDTWSRVGAQVPHVVTHVTVSVGSPSSAGK